MTFTVLLDLDDTLLENDINAFIRSYFGLLGEALSKHVDPQKMLQAMRSAVNAMLTKELPANTLEETFDQVFYPMIGVPKVDLLPAIQEFYQNRYPRLQPLTQPRKQAVRLVESLVGRGISVVIATNPLFPRTAILQRLEWAGIGHLIPQLSLVTDYSWAHYCKPNPAYYAEILAYLRWQPGPVVMIGNSLEDDILPVERLGLPTFFLSEEKLDQTGANPLSRSGTLEEVLPWIDQVLDANLIPAFDSISAILATLQATPAVLDSYSRIFPPNQWNRRPSTQDWSFTEILCHLRDVDLEVNLQRIETVASGSTPFLPGINTDSWAEERNYTCENGISALQQFMDARAEILKRLFTLPESSWHLAARHAIFGPTTLKELVGFIATHDRVHISQSWEALL